MLISDINSNKGMLTNKEKYFNPIPNKPLFLHVCSRSLLKMLWEKEKLLVTSNFSFFHSVFYPSRDLPTNVVKSEIVVCNFFKFGSLQFL